jgi:hypothetical protein
MITMTLWPLGAEEVVVVLLLVVGVELVAGGVGVGVQVL